MRKQTIGIVGSIAVHAMVVLSLLLHKTDGKPVPVFRAPPPIEVTLLDVFGEMDKEADKADPLDINGNVCPGDVQTYVGIGIIYHAATGMVLKAPYVLPAYKAGIRIGDYIEELHRIKLVAGEEVTLHVARYDEHLTITVTPMKICFKETQEE